KPTGVKHELVATLNYLKRDNPDINLALVLRDILDSPENTIRVWRKRGYYDTIQVFYDFLFVLGVPEVFDPRKEYSFPRSVSDLKPTGVKHELVATLNYLKRDNPDINLALVLRDILDSPENTIRVWRKRGYYDTIQVFYDFLFVLGVPEVFDPRKEYSFPRSVSDKVRFCGYLRRESGTRGRSEIR